MTRRHQDIFVLAALKRQLEQQQGLAFAVQAGVGALFAKDGGKALWAGLGKQGDKLDGLMAARAGVRPPTAEEAAAAAKAVAAGMARATRGATPANPAEATGRTYENAMTGGQVFVSDQVSRDLKALDLVMTKITGSPVQNPMAGYQRGQAPTMHDVGKDWASSMQRM